MPSEAVFWITWNRIKGGFGVAFALYYITKKGYGFQWAGSLCQVSSVDTCVSVM